MDSRGVLDVFKTLTMKSNNFWDVTPCIMVEDYGRIGKMYCLHILGRRKRQTSSKEQGILQMEMICSSKSLENFYTRIHGFTSHNIVLYTCRAHIEPDNNNNH
jgi:hypothetical protein